ncbi:MAG TPA: hypothetical protein VGD52_01045 [Pseudoduganella sp.]
MNEHILFMHDNAADAANVNDCARWSIAPGARRQDFLARLKYNRPDRITERPDAAPAPQNPLAKRLQMLTPITWRDVFRRVRRPYTAATRLAESNT